MARAIKGPFRRLLLEWLVLTLLLLSITWGLSISRLLPTVELVYDRLLSWSFKAPDPRILIVAIDDYSLSELGRWPWSRSVHAALLERLKEAGTLAVLFDILFVEPESLSGADAELAWAMHDHGMVFVPLALAPTLPPQVLLPIVPLQNGARDIGHINVEVDRDGMLRRIYLREGDGRQWWNQLAWVAQEALADKGVVTRREMPGSVQSEVEAMGTWRRDHQVLIPYRGPPGHYPYASYVSVLRGDVPEALLRDRIVLIGATAAGLGDRHAVPVASGMGSMPGVEIQANLLNALMDGRVVVELEKELSASLSVLPVALMMLGMLLLKWRYTVWLMAVILGMVLGGAWIMLLQGWWWPPWVSMAMLLLAFVLWSWRSQATALTWFGREIATLKSLPRLLRGAHSESRATWGSALHKHVLALELAVDHLSDAHHFLADVLDSLPIATFIVTEQGRVLLANRQAQTLAGTTADEGGQSLREVLRTLAPADATLSRLMEREAHGGFGDWNGEDFIDGQGNHFRVEAAPLWTAVSAMSTGWLVALVDMTSEHRAAEQRAHLLRFLSHDLKAPQASILALTALQRNSDTALPHDQFCRRVERQVRSALSMTEEFMQLTKVEFGALDFRVVLLADIVMDALDRAWPLAEARDIRVESELPDDGCPLLGDGAFLGRAIFNLLENAIKYSSGGTCVQVRVWQVEERVLCRVQDQGVGIAEQDLPHIFESYRRFDHGDAASGFGLGLALVKTVVDKHQGRIRCESREGEGSTFTVDFPAWDKQGEFSEEP